jgi:hypothetical protein
MMDDVEICRRPGACEGRSGPTSIIHRAEPMRAIRWIFPGLTVLMLGGGCTPPGGPEPDCQACVPRGSQAGVRFQRDALIPGGDTTSVLTVVFDDGRQVRTTRSTEWSGGARSRWGPYVETATDDSLRATGILQSAAGDTLAVGRIVLPLRRDWWWGVRWDVARTSAIRALPGIDPEGNGWYFPLRTDAGQADPRALYVWVGIRSISSPTPF